DVSLTDVPNAGAYSIMAVSFVLIHKYPKDSERTHDVLAFFQWALEAGRRWPPHWTICHCRHRWCRRWRDIGMQGASPPPKAPQPLGKAHGPRADLENREGVPNRGSDAMGAPIIDLGPKT